eukprot:3988049-Prymnesium_polylepis.1
MKEVKGAPNSSWPGEKPATRNIDSPLTNMIPPPPSVMTRILTCTFFAASCTDSSRDFTCAEWSSPRTDDVLNIPTRDRVHVGIFTDFEEPPSSRLEFEGKDFLRSEPAETSESGVFEHLEEVSDSIFGERDSRPSAGEVSALLSLGTVLLGFLSALLHLESLTSVLLVLLSLSLILEHGLKSIGMMRALRCFMPPSGLRPARSREFADAQEPLRARSACFVGSLQGVAGVMETAGDVCVARFLTRWSLQEQGPPSVTCARFGSCVLIFETVGKKPRYA